MVFFSKLLFSVKIYKMYHCIDLCRGDIHDTKKIDVATGTIVKNISIAVTTSIRFYLGPKMVS